MKKLISVLLSVLLCVGLCACSKEESHTPEPVIPEVGDSFTFGTFGGTEKIEWIVLAEDNGKVLLLSRYALTASVYHESWDDVTWESSSLRASLNGEFLDSAFTDKEQNKILTTTVTADPNPVHGTDPGNATEDKIFLLSPDEVSTYLPKESDRICTPTDFAADSGVWKNPASGACIWWLRTPGIYSDNAVCIGSDGTVNADGDDVITSDNGVRPAMWVDLNP